MKQLQIMIAGLYVLKRSNHIKCTIYEYIADNDCGICIDRFNHIKCTKYETFAENDCGTICIKEVQPRKMYTM